MTAKLIYFATRSLDGYVEDAQGNLWVASRKPERIDFLRRQSDGRYVLEDPGVRQQRELALQERAAGVALGDGGLVGRRGAAHRGGDPGGWVA